MAIRKAFTLTVGHDYSGRKWCHGLTAEANSSFFAVVLCSPFVADDQLGLDSKDSALEPSQRRCSALFQWYRLGVSWMNALEL